MPQSANRQSHHYPAVAYAEFDSPIDALIALGIPRDEAQETLVATWSATYANHHTAVITATHTEQQYLIAALHLPSTRWAACKVFLEKAWSTPREVERRMGQLFKHHARECKSTGAFSLTLTPHEIALLTTQTFTNADIR